VFPIEKAASPAVLSILALKPPQSYFAHPFLSLFELKAYYMA
jgi:hypothetical protein